MQDFSIIYYSHEVVFHRYTRNTTHTISLIVQRVVGDLGFIQQVVGIKLEASSYICWETMVAQQNWRYNLLLLLLLLQSIGVVGLMLLHKAESLFQVQQWLMKAGKSYSIVPG